MKYVPMVRRIKSDLYRSRFAFGIEQPESIWVSIPPLVFYYIMWTKDNIWTEHISFLISNNQGLFHTTLDILQFWYELRVKWIEQVLIFDIKNPKDIWTWDVLNLQFIGIFYSFSVFKNCLWRSNHIMILRVLIGDRLTNWCWDGI